MKKIKTIIASLIIGAFILGACNMPSKVDPADVDATTIAETAAAVFTHAAETAAATGVPSATTIPTATITPTMTLSPTVPPPTATNTPIPCNRGIFIKDVTYPDNTEVVAGTTFTKTWRIKNNGSCVWNSNYVVLFDSGEKMNAPASFELTNGTVAPGETVDISVDLTAPSAAGTYQANFKLRSHDNIVFGITTDAQGPFWVKIVVPNPTPTPTITATTNPNDLAITNIGMAGGKVTFDFTMTGSLTGDFTFLVYVDGTSLAPNACAVAPTGTCTSAHTVAGTQTIKIVIDPQNTIPESNENNNQMEKSCDAGTGACN